MKSKLYLAAAAVCFLSALVAGSAQQQPVKPEPEPLWVEMPVENHQVSPGQWRIPLNMEEHAGVDRQAEPVRCGVPIPRGALRDLNAIRLEDENGGEKPLQAEEAAFWPDGSFKWVLLNFFADLKAGEKKAYSLSFGKGVSRAKSVSPLKVAETDETITVDTGKIRFVMLKRKNVFINEAWVDANGDGKYAEAERVVAPLARGEQRGLFVDLWHKSRGTSLYWAALQPKPDSVTIEAAGPNCAEICFKGWHHADRGHDPWSFVSPRSFQYVLRVRAYAGSSALRVSHTFVNTEDPLDIRVRSIGIRLPVVGGDKPQYAFGSAPAFRKAGGTNEEYYLVQDHWDNFSFEKGGPMPELASATNSEPVELMGQYQGGQILEKGKTCERWMDVSGPGAGLTVAFRDMEKLFPKELGVQGNDTFAYIWPKHKRPTKYEFFGGGLKSYMDLRQPNEIMYPDVVLFKEKYPGVYNKWMVGTDSDWERYLSYPNRCNALGVAKTHELIYDFHSGQVNPAWAKSLAAGAGEPIQPYVTPQWYCWETEALGRMQPQDPQNFPRMETEFNAFMDWLYRHQNEWSHLWGIFDYGCMQTYYNPRKSNEQDYPTEELGPWGKLQGRYGWLNGEYNNDHDAFTQYFRSGRYRDFKFAAAYAAHHADVDTCHYNTSPDWVGAQHRHSILHWSDWLIDQQTFCDGMVDLYYTTGDRRARDVALEVAGFSMYAGIPFRYFQEAGTVEYRKHRGTWNKITNIARCYEMTADPEMRRHLDAWVKVLEENLNPWGGPAGENEAYLGACLPLVYAVTDSEAVKKIIVETGFASGVTSLGSFSPYSALRWRFTKDTGPFLAPQVWGVGYRQRKGEIQAAWTNLQKDSFTTGRTTPTLAWPHMMGALYDAKYDDRTPPQPPAIKPPADLPAGQRYETIPLAALMNEDPFGDMRNGKGLPWPKPGTREKFIDDTLGKPGGKIVFCGSGEPGFKADQNITRKIVEGEIPLCNWSIYPCYMFEPPVTRSFAPVPPVLMWGSVPFEILDPKFNGGKGYIALKGGEKVTIPVGKTVRRLYFLGHVYALRYQRDPGSGAIVPLMARTEVGRYTLRFDDGKKQDVPIVNRQNASACIYGYLNDEAPFVLGSAGGSGWPPSGGVCAFELDAGNRPLKEIEFSGSDSNKAVMLWAVTAVVDGPPLAKLVKTVLFGNKQNPGDGIEIVTATDTAAAGKSGWVSAEGIKDGGSACVLPADFNIHTLCVALPEDGWYQVDLSANNNGNAAVMNIAAGGRMAMWGARQIRQARFFAEARQGVMDISFVGRPFSIDKQPAGKGNITMNSVKFSKLPSPPANPPEPMDLAKALRFGWDATAEPNEQRGGCLYDNVLRIDVPPGEYQVSIKINRSPISSPGVKCDVYAQDKLVLDDLPVSMKDLKSFAVSAPEGKIKLRVGLDPKSSTGRIQQWALDRLIVERTK